MAFANNKGADQPTHPHSLISAFVLRCIDTIIPILAKSKISRLQLVSVAELADLRLTWSHTSEDRFSRDMAHIAALVACQILICLRVEESTLQIEQTEN